MKKVLLITALVFGLGVAGFAGSFSGWTTDLTITTPQTPTFTLRSVLTVDYTIGDWTFAVPVPGSRSESLERTG